MRKVLHVGPCDSPGGMATVMQTLAEHPPEGWEAELLSSHVQGGLWSKWRAYRRARKDFINGALTPHPSQMWFTFTQLPIGRGAGNSG